MRNLKLGLVLLLCIVLSPTAQGIAQDAQPQVTDQVITDFAALVETEMANFHIPGVAVAVIEDGVVRYANGFGVRDVATGESFTTETRFRIGSTTKSMTSFLVAQLVDEGKLSWDTPVTEIFPTFQTSVPELTAQITVGDLMGMGTGLVTDELRSLDWGAWTVDDLLSVVADQAAEGTYHEDYSYNNEVYSLAGYAATVAAGNEPTLENYRALLQERVFDPINMPSAIITDDLSLLGDNYARSYEFSLLSDVETPSLALPVPIGVIGPAGGVWTNINDMARYVITQVNGGVTPDGTVLVSADTLAETWKPGVRTQPDEDDARDLFYGMGWVTLTMRDITTRFHDGGWEGYRTLMVVFPETNIGLVIFSNHIYGDLYNYAMLEAFAELLYGMEPQALTNWHAKFDAAYGSIDAELAQLPDAAIDPADAAPLLGEYESGLTVEQREDNVLWLLYGPWQFALQPLPTPNGFIIANSTALGTPIQFSVEGEQVSLSMAEGALTVQKVK